MTTSFLLNQHYLLKPSGFSLFGITILKVATGYFCKTAIEKDEQNSTMAVIES